MLNSPPTVAQPSTVKGKRPLRISPIVDGLDSSIVIDPHRLHMTLGVMALQKEHTPTAPDTLGDPAPLRPTAPSSSTSNPAAAPANSHPSSSLPSQSPPSELHESDVSPPPEPGEGPRTVATALALLRSLQPQISAILDGSRGVQVPLEVLDVLKITRITAPKARRDADAVAHHASDPPIAIAEDDRSTSDIHAEPVQESEHVEKVGAGVLFVGPKHVARAEEDEDQRKLREVSELIHRAFKDAGYITEQRPLKLHCTLLNASHRKPARRAPFAYTDVLAASSACALLDTPGPAATVPQAPEAGDGAPSVSVAEVPPPPQSQSPHAVWVEADAQSASGSLGDATMAVGGLEETYTPTLTTASTFDASPPHAPTANANAQAKANANAQAKASANAKEKKEGKDDEKEPRPRYPPPPPVPPPREIALGTYRVGEVQLWVMGSRGRRGEYVSCGGVRLE